MNEVKTFENEDFGQIRTVAIDGEPWLVGKEVNEDDGRNKKMLVSAHEDDNQ